MSKATKIIFLSAMAFLGLVSALCMIPGVLSLQIYANQASAILSVKTLLNAEREYRSSHPDSGYTCSLEALASTRLIPDDLAAGEKLGYRFTLSDCKAERQAQITVITGFKITAVPESVGHTGRHGFCADEKSTLMLTYDRNGGTNCTEEVQ